MRHPQPGSLVLGALTAAAVLCTSPRPAAAYGEQTHQEMAEYAYELMLYMGRDPTGFARLSVNLGNDPEYQQFVRDAGSAVPILRSLPAGLPEQAHTTCNANDYADSVPGDFHTKTLGQMQYALRHDFNLVDGCGLFSSPCRASEPNCRDGKVAYRPGEPFNELNPTGIGTGDYTGVTLGYWAGHPDKNHDDTHMQYRITNMGAAGVAKRTVSDVIDTAGAALLAPAVCLYKWLKGDGGNCWRSAKDIARAANPVEELEGLIPGFNADVDPKFTGLWHFINMNPEATADYDDRPGWYPADAGPWGRPGAVEFAAYVDANATGRSIDYEPSNGPRQYSIEQGGDHHEDTHMRTPGEWQYAPYAHTVMEPLDNLAFYGWKRYLSHEDRSARALQWPLHAFGDAAAPHHVVGTSGYGHRPYEDAVLDRSMWSLIRLIPPRDGSRSLTAPPYRTPINLPNSSMRPSLSRQLQLEQAVRVAERAFAWRKFVLAWRREHPDRARDIPVRNMVTQLAQESFDYTMAKFAETNEFPFNDWASVRYGASAEGAATQTYLDMYGFADHVRPLVENSMAATLAFLTSIPEVQ